MLQCYCRSVFVIQTYPGSVSHIQTWCRFIISFEILSALITDIIAVFHSQTAHQEQWNTISKFISSNIVPEWGKCISRYIHLLPVGKAASDQRYVYNIWHVKYYHRSQSIVWCNFCFNKIFPTLYNTLLDMIQRPTNITPFIIMTLHQNGK